MGMYQTQCANNCGKILYTYAKNRRGELPTVYCSPKCEGEAKDKKRFIKYER